MSVDKDLILAMQDIAGTSDYDNSKFQEAADLMDACKGLEGKELHDKFDEFLDVINNNMTQDEVFGCVFALALVRQGIGVAYNGYPISINRNDKGRPYAANWRETYLTFGKAVLGWEEVNPIHDAITKLLRCEEPFIISVILQGYLPEYPGERIL